MHRTGQSRSYLGVSSLTFRFIHELVSRLSCPKSKVHPAFRGKVIPTVGNDGMATDEEQVPGEAVSKLVNRHSPSAPAAAGPAFFRRPRIARKMRVNADHRLLGCGGGSGFCPPNQLSSAVPRRLFGCRTPEAENQLKRIFTQPQLKPGPSTG